MSSEKLLELLSNGNQRRPLMIALLGPAGAGKTLRLREVIKEAKKRKWKSILVDLQAARDIYDEDDFYEWFVDAIRPQWPGSWNTRNPRLDLIKLLRIALTKSKSNVVVCLDSLEQLSDPCARSLIATLREIQTFAASQPAWSRFKCVLAGCVSIVSLKRRLDSPNLQFTLVILPDPTIDSHEATLQHLQSSGKAANEAAVNRLSKLTRGEESFLKLLVDRMPTEISEADVEEATRLVMKDASQIAFLRRPVQLYQIDEEFRSVVNSLLEDRLTIVRDSVEDISRYQLIGAICIDPRDPQKPEFRNGLVKKVLYEVARSPTNNPELTLLSESRSEICQANSTSQLLNALRKAWEGFTDSNAALYLTCREANQRNLFEISEDGIQSGTFSAILEEERVTTLTRNGMETQMVRRGALVSAVSSWRGDGLILSIVSRPADDLLANVIGRVSIQFWMSFLEPLCQLIQDHMLKALGRHLLRITPCTPRKIFVSSTFLDLDEHRALIMQEIQRRDFFFRGMEHFGAAPFTTDEFIKEQVRKSDIYLGVFALRYGSEDPSTGKSMTELEYDEAVRLGKPRLCYLASDESQILKGHIEKDPDKLRKLQEFLSRVKREVVYEFKDIHDLARQVYVDLGDPEKTRLY